MGQQTKSDPPEGNRPMPLTASLSTALLACGLAIGTYPMLAGGLSAALGPAAWAATATAVPFT
jgi:hypothetical protein